ncbi:uncharacterized protein LOC135389541 [Ornithodoros turicata]|uniref:uncharacterized protein LOC135389541 n=1 Tax=Ornithodoros turicata TaxID=34597 RepID=UPI0031392649
MAHLEQQFPDSTHIYTDGSSANGRSSSASTVKGFTKGYRLSHATTSTAAELHAILKALRHIDGSPAQKRVLCTDSKAALATIIKQDTDDQMVYHIYKAYTSAVGRGHTISLQWIPSHCGIPGNEVADQTAKDALGKTKLSAMHFTKSDTKTFLHKSTIRWSKESWKQALRHTDFLSHIDPDLTAIIPHDIGRSLHTAIHRIRLGALYTATTQFQIGIVASRLCDICKVPQDTLHVLIQCPEQADARERLSHALQTLDKRPFAYYKVMGRWPTREQDMKALKALCVYLKESGIHSRY